MAGPKKYDPALMGKKLSMDKNQGKTLKRLLALITGPYKFSFIMVFVCILVNSVVSAVSAMFIGNLIDGTRRVEKMRNYKRGVHVVVHRIVTFCTQR